MHECMRRPHKEKWYGAAKQTKLGLLCTLQVAIIHNAYIHWCVYQLTLPNVTMFRDRVPELARNREAIAAACIVLPVVLFTHAF